METKANYFLIGIFTLAGLLCSMAFLLWLAKVEVDRQYAYYDILFENVAGLGNAGDVRYNGLPVGRVVDLRLDPGDPSKVRVRVELDANTPVKTDTVATLQGQGVTGVSFVALSGGSPEADFLPQDAVIEAQSSPLQSVLEGAPVLLQRAVTLLENIDDVVSAENRAAVTQILDNLSSASGRLDRALEDFETLSTDLSTAATEVAGFTGRLEALADTAEVTLDAATQTLTEGRDMIARGATVLETADNTLKSADTAFASATTLMDGEITEFVRQGTATATRLESTLESVEEPARRAMARAETALEEAEQTFATANRVLNEDLDGMITDFRATVTTFRTTLVDASDDIALITKEVLDASKSVSGFASTLENVVVANSQQVSNLLRNGIPEFLRLTEEARQLVSNLDRFIDRIDRDPARYFFGTQGSEFSR